MSSSICSFVDFKCDFQSLCGEYIFVDINMCFCMSLYLY
ncbi:hypothetical protein ECHHL_0781 [Ehrlichia chaffeensis str. Heartland]|nr:hypothetical protein ECHHL_0781 [Ehrlichia chaffeensis str. Heartland]AHX05344.1 hypothetical protein ECHJAX_0267 [Ehrlichia chaffeensis str. Jax]AHX06332.1 hypothetical protein ECHLIB_0264 [Ehrlichia chaffeensis str. Liberty]AHX07588.1 hypothetical protein ECHOSC_0792 [Ehrlichia chaffeensis str. Osceola]AHX08159.1 hypothetical protein ECHSTV_0260 [Ehrlichia chaffeensis str. Saint Vincent]AHX09631.1 hypothetical protein ECHWAK_0264 [Ehrlichia chaffeensis str. Wakulla]AHX10798.1 hypothetica